MVFNRGRKGLLMPTPTEALVDYLEARDLSISRRYLREALQTLTQAIMESEVSRILDAAHYERNPARRAYRNGYRQSTWSTPVGEIELHIPKLRKGSYYPHFLDNITTQHLLRLAQTAYIEGTNFAQVSTELQSLTATPLHNHDLADIAQRLDDAVHNAHNSPLRIDYPYLLLDVVDVDQHNHSQWRQFALVFGVDAAGSLRLLGHELVAEIDEMVWQQLLRRLRQRGLPDPQAVISDDFWGARSAVETELVDAVWEHQHNFRLRQEDAAVVDAVSNLYIRAESDQDNLPHMRWIAPVPEYDFLPDYPLFVVA